MSISSSKAVLLTVNCKLVKRKFSFNNKTIVDIIKSEDLISYRSITNNLHS